MSSTLKILYLPLHWWHYMCYISWHIICTTYCKSFNFPCWYRTFQGHHNILLNLPHVFMHLFPPSLSPYLSPSLQLRPFITSVSLWWEMTWSTWLWSWRTSPLRRNSWPQRSSISPYWYSHLFRKSLTSLRVFQLCYTVPHWRIMVKTKNMK